MPRTLEQQKQRAEKLRIEATDRSFELVLNMLKSWTLVCRWRGSNMPAQKQREYEWRARRMLGRAATTLARFELTPKQSDLFQQAFRDLADCIPFHAPADVIQIDSREKIA